MSLKNLIKVANYLKLFAQEEVEELVSDPPEDEKDKPQTENTSTDVAREVGEKLGIDWESSKFPPEELAKGINVEYEHGTRNADTNITDDDIEMTAKIALAHLKESSEYYILLAEMEKKFAKD